jgi:hypothetical protein
MKIGIMTFYHNSENYGAVLQAYALNKYLSVAFPKWDIETIDYAMAKNELGGRWQNAKLKTFF